MPKLGMKVWGREVLHPDLHLQSSDLMAMRMEVDDAGDSFLASLIDRFPRLETCSQGELRAEVQKAFNSFGALSSASEAVSAFEKFIYHVESHPTWLNFEMLQRGQRVYLKHSLGAHLALLYSSLIGGFSAPKITKVLVATGYLTQQNPRKVWGRLLETFEMVFDCLETDIALSVGNSGWFSVLYVRVLHSRVRRRILLSSESSKGAAWNSSQVPDDEGSTLCVGKPINQMDLLATLLSFSINVIDIIEKKIGNQVSYSEQMAYLHLWKYIGFLIGIDERNLHVMDSPEAARGALESLVLHLLHPDRSSCEIAQNILNSVTGQPPLCWSKGFHTALARELLGEELADGLKLDKTSDLFTKVYLVLFLTLLRFLTWAFPQTEESVARKRRLMRIVLNKQLTSIREPITSPPMENCCPFGKILEKTN